jgi:hypothetical protein
MQTRRGQTNQPDEGSSGSGQHEPPKVAGVTSARLVRRQSDSPSSIGGQEGIPLVFHAGSRKAIIEPEETSSGDYKSTVIHNL